MSQARCSCKGCTLARKQGAEDAAQRVRDLHKPIRTEGVLGSVVHCSHCSTLIQGNPKILMMFWPCKTLVVLDGEP